MNPNDSKGPFTPDSRAGESHSPAPLQSPFDLFESQEQAQFNPDTFAEALKRTAIDITRQYAKHLLPIVLLTLNMLLGVSL